ncbi:MAG: SLC13 family permease [Chloroflexi bacterium]|nr:MAG: SLC13 family permease [Chloroflexota bacterium]
MELTNDMWVVIAILAVAIFLFITEWLRVDVVALGVVVCLTLTGILTPEQAIAGFSSSALITIAALFIVGGAVLQTGLASMIGRRILGIAGSDEKRLIVVIMVATALLSGVMSNTGTVAVLLPAIVGLAYSAKISPSKLLIPLAFAASLGGAMTLIGTPPNIIMADALKAANVERIANGLETFHVFQFFDFTLVGAPLLIGGVLFMATIGRRLLPDYKPDIEELTPDNPQELMDSYGLNGNLAYLRIQPDSKLVGVALGDTRIRRDYDITVVEIIRSNQLRPVAQFGKQRIMIETAGLTHIFPTAQTVLHADDILVLQGQEAAIRNLAYSHNLSFESPPEDTKETLVNRQIGVAEVVLPPRSSLIGKTLRQVRFGPSYNLTVLGIKRPGASEPPDIKKTTLRFGDILLVRGLWHDIMALKKQRSDFVVMGQPETMIDNTNTNKAPVAAAIMATMLIILMFEILPLVTASLLAALAIILTGCLTMDEAYESIDWKSILLIGGMLPMATALTEVGLVNEIALQVQNSVGSANPRIIVGVLFLLTAVLTQVLSNTATAVLLAPIALQIADRLQITPYSLLMSVALGASMAFASPVASPVNTLVLGAGQYKFADFTKVGLPLIVIGFVISVIIIPIFFPF